VASGGGHTLAQRDPQVAIALHALTSHGGALARGDSVAVPAAQ
jgi:hypothetical protein